MKPCRFAVLFVAALSAHANSLAVLLKFDRPPSPDIASAMQKEAANLLQPAGVRPEWRIYDGRQSPGVFSDLVVVRMRGSCSDAGVPGASSFAEPLELGSTAVSNGRVLPFSEVRCDAVRASLARVTPVTPFNFGQALGRVLAHEIYHATARTTVHGHNGAARETFGRPELIDPGLRFEAADSARISETRADRAPAAGR